ncbi:hypothetical protein CLV71_12660 [Actinophytocola oryzae]|uniref:Uncharacterized protein n=1 Tax=Actinophytocola oryzae TaxID=502181 RepID=A0A4R7USZ1_9PSEU|nr:hypothetical protein CLV71_12660 [Actinophytocola oryzae]
MIGPSGVKPERHQQLDNSTEMIHIGTADRPVSPGMGTVIPGAECRG